MRAAIDPGMLATDLADYLVQKGLPFARRTPWQASVQQALKSARRWTTLPWSNSRISDPLIHEDVYAVFDPQQSVARRNAIAARLRKRLKCNCRMQNSECR